MNWGKQLWVAVAVVLGASAVAAPGEAVAQDYLKGKTWYWTQEERSARHTRRGDFMQDYQPEHVSGNSDAAQRARVEEQVRKEMEAIRNTSVGDAHGHDRRVDRASFDALVERAQAGDAVAIAGVAQAFHHGTGVEKNEQQAVEWYKRAIEYGQNDYYSVIGDMYRDRNAQEKRAGLFSGLKTAFGSGAANEVKRDNTVARQWYERGVYAGDWQSYIRLGELYRAGEGGLQKNPERAQWYRSEGMRLKKERDARVMRETEQRIRARLEREQGLRDGDVPDVGGNTPSRNPSVVIGDYYCALLPAKSPTTLYRFFYEAYCTTATEGEKAEPPAKVMVENVECEVKPWPASTTRKMFELRCR